ncbi:hypothetical protein ABZ707_06565 [Streptomyces sp. NPDC006923]|uniref:hypothetical protein n=1 Tax=Streptomyces sp. NPDC006923 TaxID=3155355 RepID=UPI0033FB1861
MWSTLGEWLVFLTTILLIVLGLAAGTGLTKLIFEGIGALSSAYEARERDGRRGLGVVWAAWVLRLVAVVLVPVLGVAHVAAVLWLLNASTATRLLLALPLAAIVIPLFLSPLFLWDHGAVGMGGSSLMALAAFALLAGFVAGGWSVQLGLLQWRGSETMCSVSLGDDQGTSVPAGGGAESWLYTYELDCAAADAPVAMKTYTPVLGERTRVVYDPSGFAGVAHEAELDDLTFSGWFASGAVALWTVLSLGNVLTGIPLVRNPNAWP